jgi:peptidyl-tRNA hydrolase
MALCVREDLGMTPGKIATQVAHGAVTALLAAQGNPNYSLWVCERRRGVEEG